MKQKVTLSIDRVIIEEAKSQGINISAAAEQGISAFLGRSQQGKVQRGKNGEFVMTDEVRKELESAYSQFEDYMLRIGPRYDNRKGTIWIYDRAVHVGMDPNELLGIFEDRYKQHLANLSQTPIIEVSPEATDKLLDTYFNSFSIFVDFLHRNYISQQGMTDALLRSKVESASGRWIHERRKRLMGISRKELYSILKDRYNEKKGKTIL